MTATLALPKVLRTISAYVVEWHYAYPSGLLGDNFSQQFCFLPHAFNACLSRGKDIALTQDMDASKVFASIASGTLRITSDDTGLLITAKLLDSPENRLLCRLIDAGRVKGWSHKFRPVLGGYRTRFEIQQNARITSHHRAELQELTIVIRKRPRQLVRKTPIFLSGGPKVV